MKLLFKFLIFLSLPCQGQIINIYKYKESHFQALYIKDLFIQKYHIPNEFITLKKIGAKKNMNKERINLQINKKGELKLLPSNISFNRKILNQFKSPI